MRSGFCAVVGRPNVGKSTLVNRMVGSKVAITSSRPQTTRNVIRGVLTGDDFQLVLVDTPGLHKPRNELGTRLNTLVTGTLAESDVVLFVVDATAPIGPGDKMIAERLVESGAPVVVAVNKVDAAGKPVLGFAGVFFPRRARYNTRAEVEPLWQQDGGGGVAAAPSATERRPVPQVGPIRRRKLTQSNGQVLEVEPLVGGEA